jgi:hypothetical protein
MDDIMTMKFANSEEIDLKIVGGTNFARYPKMTDEATINMMVTSSNDISALVPYDGYQQVISFLGNQEPREIYVSTLLNAMLVAVGNNIYLVQNDLFFRSIGQLQTFLGPVYFAENLASEIGIVDNLNLYIYNYANNTFQIIDLPDIIPAYIAFLDTYFILTDSNQRFWQISNSDDGATYNPLMIAYLQTEADQLQCVVPLNRTLWVMGQKVSELWNDNPTGYNASGVGNPVSFPFQRNNSISINYGVLSVQTVCSDFQILVWLAFSASSSPTIVYTRGGAPEELSPDGLDYVLKNLTAPQDSTAILFKEYGHILYQITFYTDNLSIVYDFANGLWYIVTDEAQNYHIAKRAAIFNNNLYFINFSQDNPGLFLMSAQNTTYNGDIIPRIRICPPIRFKGKRFITKYVDIDMEQGENEGFRYIDFSMSKNGGQSYGNVYRKVMFPVGYREGQNRFQNLGLCNDLRVKFMFLSPGRIVALSATARVQVGS